jgi:hypothetical protein
MLALISRCLGRIPFEPELAHGRNVCTLYLHRKDVGWRPSNDLRISCGRSCWRPHKPTLPQRLHRRVPPARSSAPTPARRLHARVRRRGAPSPLGALGLIDRLRLFNKDRQRHPSGHEGSTNHRSRAAHTEVAGPEVDDVLQVDTSRAGRDIIASPPRQRIPLDLGRVHPVALARVFRDPEVGGWVLGQVTGQPHTSHKNPAALRARR